MKRKTWAWSVVWVALWYSWAAGDERALPAPQLAQAPPPAQPPRPPQQAPATPPETDQFAQAPPTPSDESVASYSPNMVGDFLGVYGCRFVTVTGTQTIVTTVREPQTERTKTTTTTVSFTAAQTVCVPAAVYGAFKIGENESPRPMDRVFVAYNYFSDATSLPGPDNVPVTNQTVIHGTRPGFGTFKTTVTTHVPAALNPQFNVNREFFGFEKTFLDRGASIGLRAPVFQQGGDGSFGADDFGDLSAILKYAFYSNPATLDLISVGMVATAPTGPGIETIDGTIHSVFLQPYGGFIWNVGAFYFNGFTSLAIPTDSRDVTIWFNDVGVGCWLYRGALDNVISSVVPIVEAHVTTPMNNRDANAAIFVPDLVNLTAGAHIGLKGRWWLTLGVVTPVTGPRPFDVEAAVQLNRWF